MHIKCLPRSRGSARAAVDYLVGERDAEGHRREGVEVLRGNPDIVAAVADSLEFERKYTSVVIAWAPEDQPTDAQIGAVVDEFDKTAWAGLKPDRYAWTAVLHRERDGGVHVYVLAAQCDLETGRSLNIAPPGWQKAFDPLRNAFNHEHGWSRPDDPARARAQQPGPPGLHRGVEAAGGPRARSRPARVDPRLPGAARRARRGAEPRRRGLRPGGSRLRSAAPRQGLRHRPRSGQRKAVAAERSAVRA